MTLSLGPCAGWQLLSVEIKQDIGRWGRTDWWSDCVTRRFDRVCWCSTRRGGRDKRGLVSRLRVVYARSRLLHCLNLTALTIKNPDLLPISPILNFPHFLCLANGGEIENKSDYNRGNWRWLKMARPFGWPVNEWVEQIWAALWLSECNAWLLKKRAKQEHRILGESFDCLWRRSYTAVETLVGICRCRMSLSKTL